MQANEHASMSVAEAARLLGYSHRTILRYVAQGRLDGFKVADRTGKIRVYVRSVQALIANSQLVALKVPKGSRNTSVYIDRHGDIFAVPDDVAHAA